MRELDNLAVASLGVLLNEDTTLKRFYPLIPMKEVLMERLPSAGIEDKYDFGDWADQLPELAGMLQLDVEALQLFERFLHLHDFVNRRLKDVKSVSVPFRENLALGGVKTSGGYLLLCMKITPGKLAGNYGAEEEEVRKLFSLCDLMRLPGVKDVRASLYYDCGYPGLEAFARQTGGEMQRKIARYIAENQVKKSVPFPKELNTQIAAAKVLPHLNPPGFAALR